MQAGNLRVIAAILGLLIVATTLAAQSGQFNRVTNRDVAVRIEAMNTNAAALRVLDDMMAGRTPHDPARARMARRVLIDSIGRIPILFRKTATDPLSHARKEIWSDWSGFTAQAKSAQRVARSIDPRSAARLRKTAPAMLSACLSCHHRFRDDAR